MKSIILNTLAFLLVSGTLFAQRPADVVRRDIAGTEDALRRESRWVDDWSERVDAAESKVAQYKKQIQSTEAKIQSDPKNEWAYRNMIENFRVIVAEWRERLDTATTRLADKKSEVNEIEARLRQLRRELRSAKD